MFSLKYEYGPQRAPNADAVDWHFSILSVPSRDELGWVVGRVTGKVNAFLSAGGTKYSQDEIQRGVLDSLVFRVRELGTEVLRQLDPGPAVIYFSTTNGGYEEIERHARPAQKSCWMQIQEPIGLFCEGARNSWDAHSKPQRITRTSRNACTFECPMPDDLVRCSHLMHPTVEIGQTGKLLPVVKNAICDRGQTIGREAAKCVPGGRPCWELVFEQEHRAVPLDPVSIQNALDAFGLTWRIAFTPPGSAPVKILAPASLGKVAQLSQPVTTRAELEQRASDLADVLKGLDIDSTLLAVIPPQTKLPDKKHSFLRLENCIKNQLDPADQPRADAAVSELRAASDIRNCFQHGGAQAKGVAAAAQLGLPWPLPPAAETWAVISNRVTDALRELKAAFETLI